MIQMLGLPLLMSLALAGVLGYLGMHVLKREIIFVDIALAQLAAMGTIAAHLAFHAHMGSLLSFLVSFAFVLLAAAFYAFARRRVAQIPVEAVIGVSYAITAAGALFLAGVAPGGHVHVQHMLAGSILWVTWRDVLVCVAAFAAVGGIFRVFRGPLTAVSENYDAAARDGVNVVLWDFVFYALCGFVIALAVRVSGIVVVFALLIIPATASALLTAEGRVRLLAAWLTGLAASVLGLLFAYRLNFSMGPSIALFLGLELALAGVYALRPSRGGALASAGGLAAVFLGLLLSGPISRRELAEGAEGPTRDPDIHQHASHSHAEAEGADFAELIERATGDADALVRLFLAAPDDGAKSDLVARAIEADTRTGAQLALGFLSGDPPLFFRQAVVDELEAAIGKPFGFDVAEPFAAEVNRRAAAKVARECGVDLP